MHFVLLEYYTSSHYVKIFVKKLCFVKKIEFVLFFYYNCAPTGGTKTGKMILANLECYKLKATTTSNLLEL
jgi:hypothetical protein